MQKKSKNEVLGLFLDFGGSDQLDIAYDGSPEYLKKGRIRSSYSTRMTSTPASCYVGSSLFVSHVK